MPLRSFYSPSRKRLYPWQYEILYVLFFFLCRQPIPPGSDAGFYLRTASGKRYQH